MRGPAQTRSPPEKKVNREDLEALYELARSGATAEASQARDRILEELQVELRASVEREFTRRFGPVHRFEADEYIQQVLSKVLEDWLRPDEDRLFWSKPSFADLVPYAHMSCINRALDSRKASGRHKEKLDDEDVLGVRERDRHPQRDRRNRPDTPHPMVKKERKVEDIQAALDAGVARGEIEALQRDVLLAREYRDPRPKRAEVMQEFGLPSEDAVTDIVGRTKLWLRQRFDNWGPGGETIRD